MKVMVKLVRDFVLENVCVQYESNQNTSWTVIALTRYSDGWKDGWTDRAQIKVPLPTSLAGDNKAMETMDMTLVISPVDKQS